MAFIAHAVRVHATVNVSLEGRCVRIASSITAAPYGFLKYFRSDRSFGRQRHWRSRPRRGYLPGVRKHVDTGDRLSTIAVPRPEVDRLRWDHQRRRRTDR
jgi:hypothetical protein